MKCRTYIIIGLVAAGIAACELHAAPRPQTLANTWQLDFNFNDPQRLTVQLSGDASPTTYWYVLYQVTNNTGHDVHYYPSFRLLTDTLKTVEGGANLNPGIYDVIAARHKKEYPFFIAPTKVSGLLLQGKENARASAVVFRMFDHEANSFTVFFSGLSGEVEKVPNPTYNTSQSETEENQRFFLLRKTLAVTYDLPGDRGTRANARPIRKHREWVMR